MLLVAVQLVARASNKEREMFSCEHGISRSDALAPRLTRSATKIAVVYEFSFFILHQLLLKLLIFWILSCVDLADPPRSFTILALTHFYRFCHNIGELLSFVLPKYLLVSKNLRFK